MSISVDTGDLENGTIETGKCEYTALYMHQFGQITMWSKGRCDTNFQWIVGFVHCKKFAIKIFPNFLVCYGKKNPMVY
jgi:hypothetical protein